MSLNFLTKQQLSIYWETKFEQKWEGHCELCDAIIFPFRVFVFQSIEDVLLICQGCSTNKETRTYYHTKRTNLWLSYFGPVYVKYCFCCKRNILTFFGSWHKAHVKPKSKGGSNEISNLRPTCNQCNETMRNRDMFEFMGQNDFILKQQNVQSQSDSIALLGTIVSLLSKEKENDDKQTKKRKLELLATTAAVIQCFNEECSNNAIACQKYCSANCSRAGKICKSLECQELKGREMYCSQKCQKKQWRREIKFGCKLQ